MAERRNAVLVVTGEADLGRELVAALASRGLGALRAGGGREALAMLDREPVGAVVIDAQLPLMNGFDLARSIGRQARGASLPLLILTDVKWSAAQRTAAVQGMGLLDLLVKPVDPAEVAARLAAAVIPAAAGEGLDDATLDLRPAGGRPSPPPAAAEAEAEADPEGLADRGSRSEQRQVERATQAAQSGAAELRGNLATTPFPRLLHQLYRLEATGGLFLLSGSIKKIVYFQGGHPTFIKSNRLSECLGKVLVREGLISEAQCKESLERMAASVRQQGTVLVEMGAITPRQLVVGLELQLRAKLLDIFTWTRGEYLFRTGARVPAEAVRLDMANATLIVDGVRATWSEERLREALEPLMDRYLAPSDDPALRFQELSLEPEEQAVLDSLVGTRTLREVLDRTAGPPRLAALVAYVAAVTQVVQAVDGPVAAPEAAEAAPADEEETVRERLASQLLSLRQRDPFGVLGVAADARDDVVREAYTRLARTYHPDGYRHLSPEARSMVAEIFERIHQAYGRIATAELRSAYWQRAGREEADDQSEPETSALQAAELRRRAAALAQAGDWSGARDLLASAVSLCEDAGDLRAEWGWAIHSAASEDPAAVRQAIREIRRAITLEPRRHQAYVFLGRIYSAMGKAIMAEKQFEKALQCNPECVEALDELRLQKERRPPRRYRF